MKLIEIIREPCVLCPKTNGGESVSECQNCEYFYGYNIGETKIGCRYEGSPLEPLEKLPLESALKSACAEVNTWYATWRPHEEWGPMASVHGEEIYIENPEFGPSEIWFIDDVTRRHGLYWTIRWVDEAKCRVTIWNETRFALPDPVARVREIHEILRKKV